MTTTETTRPMTGSAAADQGSVPQQAVEEAKHLAGEVASSGKDVARDVREQLRTQADEQASRVAQSLHELASELDGMSASGKGMASDVAGEVGSRVESLATRLDREGLESIMAGARRFARQRPGACLLAAALASTATARLLKAADTSSLMDAAKGQDDTNRPTQVPPTGSYDAPTTPPSVGSSVESSWSGSGTVRP
jgi:hypothetical protein